MVAAVQAELKLLPKGLATGSLAATALALAAELDDRNSATSKSMCARELRELIGLLRELAPPKKEKDATDEFTERLRARQATG